MKILSIFFFLLFNSQSFCTQDRDFELINNLFDTKNIKKIEKIYGGHSIDKNRIYKITTKDGKKYTGRFLGITQRKSYMEFDALKIVSSEGISPKIFKIDYENNFVIYSYIESRPFIDIRNEKFKAGFVKNLAKNIRKMHESERFDIRDNIFDRILNDRLPKIKSIISKIEYDLIEGSMTILKNYFNQGEDMVSSHRDLTYNVLMSKTGRVYLLDFESASLDNKYYDIANGLLFFCKDKKDEEQFKKIYFGKKLSQEQEDRIYLMKQVVLAYSAIRGYRNVLKDVKGVNFSARKSLDEIIKNRMKTGYFDIETQQGMFVYSRSLLDEFVKNVTSERYITLLKGITSNSQSR